MATTNKKPNRRWLLILLGVVVVALIVLALRPKPIEVDLATVERGALRVTLDEEGETRVRHLYVISAPVSGEVLRIELEPGDPVVADETIVATFQPAAPLLLDARTQAESRAGLEAAEADLGLARAELARATAELRFARSELARITKLAEQGVVSDDQLDSARLRAETAVESETAAEFAVRTAEHRRDQARATLLMSTGSSPAKELDPITIRSPVDGVVLKRLRQSASVVPAGETLVEVADPAQLEIVSDFLSEDAVKISAGYTVLIERWGGDHPLRGRVRRVEPSGFTKISALGVEEQRVNVIIDFEDPRDAWTALGDGFRVEARVVVWESEDVLKLPTSSLFRSDGDWAVFAVNGGRTEITPVEIGWRNGIEAEVLSGLSGGESLVLHPSDKITDGVAIKKRDS